jgi:hypothetical protein
VVEIVGHVFLRNQIVVEVDRDMPVWVSSVVATRNAVSKFTELNIDPWLLEASLDDGFFSLLDVVNFRHFLLSLSLLNLSEILMSNATVKAKTLQPPWLHVLLLNVNVVPRGLFDEGMAG